MLMGCLCMRRGEETGNLASVISQSAEIPLLCTYLVTWLLSSRLWQNVYQEELNRGGWSGLLFDSAPHFQKDMASEAKGSWSHHVYGQETER